MSSSTSEDILSVDDVIDLNHDYYSSHDLHSINDDELKLFHRDLVTPAPSVYNGEDDIIHRSMFRQRYIPFKIQQQQQQQRPISRGESVMLFKKINNGDEDVSFDLVSSELRDFMDTDSMSDDTFLFPVNEPKKTPVIFNYQQKKSLVAKEIQVHKSRQQIPESPTIHRASEFMLKKIPTPPPRIKQPHEFTTTRSSGRKLIDPPLKKEGIPSPRFIRNQVISRPGIEEEPKRYLSRHHDTMKSSTTTTTTAQYEAPLKRASKSETSYGKYLDVYEKPLPSSSSSSLSKQRLSRQYDASKLMPNNTQHSSERPSRQADTNLDHPVRRVTRPKMESAELGRLKPFRLSTTSVAAEKSVRQQEPTEPPTLRLSRRYDTTTSDKDHYYNSLEHARLSRHQDSFESNYKSLSSPRLRSVNSFKTLHQSTTDEEVKDSAKQVLAYIRERRKSTLSDHPSRTIETRQRQYNTLVNDFRSKLNVQSTSVTTPRKYATSSSSNSSSSKMATNTTTTTKLPQRSLYH